MGQIGYGLEDNDTFMDVKGSFRELIEDGLTPRDATKAVCEEFEEALAVCHNRPGGCTDGRG